MILVHKSHTRIHFLISFFSPQVRGGACATVRLWWRSTTNGRCTARRSTFPPRWMTRGSPNGSRTFSPKHGGWTSQRRRSCPPSASPTSPGRTLGRTCRRWLRWWQIKSFGHRRKCLCSYFLEISACQESNRKHSLISYSTNLKLVCLVHVCLFYFSLEFPHHYYEWNPTQSIMGSNWKNVLD